MKSKHFLRLAVAVLLTAGSVAVWSGPASADNAAVTSGGTVAVSNCAQATNQAGTVTVTKSSGQVFANSTTITVSGAATIAGRSVTVSGTGTSPSNWTTSANGTTFTVSFTTTVPIGTLSFGATNVGVSVGGLRTNGNSMSLNAGNVSVSAVCDSTPPVVTVPSNKTVEATSSAGRAVTFASEVSATDAVSGTLTPTCNPASGSTFAIGTTTVTCSATDGAGNTGTATFSITVQDTTGPVVTVPADKNLLTSGGPVTVNFAGEVSATDAVDGNRTVNCTPSSGSLFLIGTTEVTCTATDTRGNTGSATFDVTVALDTDDPVVTVPSDITVEATSSAGRAVTFADDVSATDNLDGALPATCDPASGSTFPIGTTEVECSATDAASNTGTATFDVTIQDTTDPVVTVPADKNLLTSGGPVTVNFADDVSATDGIDGARPVSCTPSSGSSFSVGTATVECTATDTSGNTGSATFDVTVALDTDDPVVTVPSDITVEATSSAGRAVTFADDVSATDNLDGALPATCDPASGSTFPIGTTEVECSATDAASNTGTATFDVTVEDTTAPDVTVPSDMTVEATSSAGRAVAFADDVSATDTVDGAVDVDCTPTSGDAFPMGTTTVDCSATDDAGNTGTASFDVTVEDTTGPSVDVPSDMTVEATGANGAAVSYASDVSATDAVDGDRPVSCDPASGTTFALGTTTVECTATDTLGNEGTATFDVTVEDTTDPAVTVPSDMTVEATSASGAAVGFAGDVSASDAVDGTVAVDCDPASGATFPLGTTTVDCSATDAASNTGTASFAVTVEDTTDPVLTVPGDATLEATGPTGRDVDFGTDVSATDAVDAAVAVACTPTSGSTFPLSTTTVDCTAVDDAGNSAADSFDVTIEDTLLPVLDLPDPITADATSPAGAAVTYAAFATDLVSGSVPVTCLPLSGSTFPVGTTTVDCTASDAASNTATGTFDVTVTPFEPPTAPTTPTTPTTDPDTGESDGGIGNDGTVFTPDPGDTDGESGGTAGSDAGGTAGGDEAASGDTENTDADTGDESAGDGESPSVLAGSEERPDATLTDADGNVLEEGAELESGDEVELHIGGFDPHSDVTIELHSDPVTLLHTKADADGFITVTVTIPEGVDPGDHELVAIGISPDGQRREVSFPIRVASPGDSGSNAPVGPVAVGILILLAGIGFGLSRNRRTPALTQEG